MPKLKLDSSTALLAQCEEGKRKTDWYDTVTTGLVLECRASGGKTFYLRYDKDGRQKQIKLAAYGAAPVHQIRKRAEKLRAEVTMGGDPAAEKAVARAVPTYAELAAQHAADARLHQKSHDTTEMYLRRHVIPRWGTHRLNEIDTRAVAQWLATKREEGLAPATVEKIRVIMSRSFSLGQRFGIAGCNRNPCQGIPRKPINNARERYLTSEEATRLRIAVANSKNTQLKFIVDWLLYTGCRLRECLDARYEHINIETQNWYLPTSKNGHSRNIPLSSAALAVLTNLPKMEGCPWVFANPDTRKPFVSIKHGWQKARDAAGLQELRLHDLRHAFSSFAINSGVDLFTVGRLLGHKSIQSTQRYSHLQNSTLLAAVEASAAKQQPIT